ncbi:MAG: AAA family ATPase [Mangrovibacterium sp.]
MDKQVKERIAAEVRLLVERESGRKVATRAGVSSATISQIINNNWDLIAPDMWSKVKLNLHIELGWQTAQTENLKQLNTLLATAQQGGLSLGISHSAGAGKSHAYKLYSRTHSDVIYVECKKIWGVKSYLNHLLAAAGISGNGTAEDLANRFVDHVKGLHAPLIIIDQMDKLKDSCMDLFVDFYNDLDGHAGFILSGVPALEKRVRRGCQLDKIGYRELFSRIGSRWISLEEVSLKDVEAICEANGVSDEGFALDAYGDCDGDLRRVRRSIEKYFLQSRKAA